MGLKNAATCLKKVKARRPQLALFLDGKLDDGSIHAKPERPRWRCWRGGRRARDLNPIRGGRMNHESNPVARRRSPEDRQ
jgi:hypothetical protein